MNHTYVPGAPTTVLATEIKQFKDSFELDRSFDELRVLRELAMARVRPPNIPQAETTSSPQGRGMLVQWFPQWWGWYSKTSNNNVQTSSTFEGELLDALADTMDDDTLIRRDTIFGQFNFTLSKGAVRLCTEASDKADTKTVMELQFEKVHLGYESRPRSGSHKFSISLGALYLHDYLTENSTFPVLIQPQTMSVVTSRLRGSSDKLPTQPTQPLFELIYEKKPFHTNTDHSLQVNSRSLDVVYNPVAMRWLIDFTCEPYRYASNQRLQAMKRRTRKQLMKNWEQILEGDIVHRASWDLQFDISAPQILLVERFTDSNAAVIVVDFGRLHLTNGTEKNDVVLRPGSSNSEDNETYATPCSTPPGSKENGSLQDIQALSDAALHQRLYDQYFLDLSDLQVLVGKVRDHWKHARTRGMSSLHVLERFNISLQIERRVVTTADPQFPSITVSGNLPRLVVHVNEQKVEAIHSMYDLLLQLSNTSEYNPEKGHPVSLEAGSPKKEESPDRTLTRLMMIQFIIDQMTFELQSRGRSVAELQVSGVRIALSKRPADLSASLSVHSLLLVDALQEFGPDFELLVASHKHVGMDSVSGSLRDSEPVSPTSPVSPGSPDPTLPRRLTSPVALTRALSTLVRDSRAASPPKTNSFIGLDQLDSEALIMIELILVDDTFENLRVANIQFNNLDIIANQETIVELIGFIRRAFPTHKSRSKRSERLGSLSNQALETKKLIRTEITFDFHRLNVLLLRAVMQDSQLIGQKIATATMSDARIQATLGANTLVSGSLGGLQVLDQTLTGKVHQRILSVGRDPIADPPSHPLEHFPNLSSQPEAFRFSVNRSYKQISQSDSLETLVEVTIRIGSVWYTHAPHLISELRSCADEFKQYLSNFARHIGAAATDMAIGLVHADEWTIPPRKRLPSLSLDGTDNSGSLSLKLDAILDSPVLVLPRSSHSTQVFVAHLGTMTLQHDPPIDSTDKQKLTLEVRNMNLYSLDTSLKGNLITGSSPVRAEDMYCCKEYGKPILHDTGLRVVLEKEHSYLVRTPNFPLEPEHPINPVIQVRGTVITPLKVSLSRGQYEQLLDTIQRLLYTSNVEQVAEERKIPSAKVSNYSDKFDLSIKALFELPVLSVELKQDHSEQPLVDLSMRDFVAKYEKLKKFESIIEVALKSLLMEDLLCPVGSRHRYMMQSSAPIRARLPAGVSKSCPDLVFVQRWKNNFGRGSLPDRLETDTLYGAVPAHWRRQPVSQIDTPNTPPPSPGPVISEENLVLISVTMTQPDPTTTDDKIQRKSVSVDFNCLDLVVSVESWMVVLDFLGIGSPNNSNPDVILHKESSDIDCVDGTEAFSLYSEIEVEVRSLTLVLTELKREIAKANVSNASVHILNSTDKTKISGSLGSMSLLDLTPHGRLYRERFLSSGREALNFQYSSYTDTQERPHDAQLKLKMSAVHYVHTQRFLAELQAFFGHFSQLRRVMVNLRTDGGTLLDVQKRDMRLSLELHAGAPVILLPVSSRSEELILLNLGELSAHNSFKFSDKIKTCLVDVMLLELVNMDVYTAKRLKSEDHNHSMDILTIGSFYVEKLGSSLLTEKCHLKLQVERNLDTYISRDFPDWSVHGILSTMDCALDPAQYMLIRGLLSYNIGENLDDLRLSMQDSSNSDENFHNPEDISEKVWTKSCISLELVNVTVALHPNHGLAALACVNFIKSRLTLDSLSDGSQDIDLVSQEVLVTDTRFQDEPVNHRSNVFTSILQPLRNSGGIENHVQAEVHHRRRRHNIATTIILHSMRLTAILDWWEAVKDFLFLNAPEPEPVLGIIQTVVTQENDESNTANNVPFELKLNITDSELVIVENTSLWDTNAVILKSTTVLAYRSALQCGEKPLSCNLSRCELFSCILGLEDETALSIIDPVGASFDLTQEKCLEIQLQPLSVRLSYHDITMFTRMLSSLPKQTLWAKQRSNGPPANAKSHVMKLSALGFAETDCETALDHCNGQLDDAALWLTQNAVPNTPVTTSGALSIQSVELQTPCLRICIIDDCRDADVPLLEITMTELSLRQSLPGPGVASANFSVDYYNRVLSGWEPFIESWRAVFQWEQTLTNSLVLKRLQVSVNSEDSVNVNITSTLVELVKLVKDNWTQDYYLSNKDSLLSNPFGSPPGYRRRSPFVPFALKNETGSKLWFKTIIATTDTVNEVRSSSKLDNILELDMTWIEVPPGETIPFTFEGRGKLRHDSTHIVRRHQISVVVDGWRPVDPVTVDRVGIYFRHAHIDAIGNSKVRYLNTALSLRLRMVFKQGN